MKISVFHSFHLLNVLKAYDQCKVYCHQFPFSHYTNDFLKTIANISEESFLS
ncbi:17163_t:CDS:1, partial [Gigaspora rosea]